MRTISTAFDALRTALLWSAIPVLPLCAAPFDTAGFPLSASAVAPAEPPKPPQPEPEPKPGEPKTAEPEPRETEEPGDSAEPEKPQFVVIEGQLIDAVGGGDEGVTITVRFKGKDGEEGELIGTVKTDKLGDFAVTSAVPIRGDIVVTCTKPMFADLVHEVTVGDEEYPPYLAEQLEGKLALIGRVTDALTQKPVAGATVTLEASYREWVETTADDGTFTIKGLTPGRGELIVEAEGYGRETQGVGKIEDFGEIVVEVKPGRIVHIEVVDDLDKPVAGASIECHDEARDDFRMLVTDEAGKAVMRGLHFDARILNVRLTHEDHVSSAEFGEEVTLPEAEVESKHELVMERAGRISGIITAGRPPKPVNGARVMTGSVQDDLSPRDWTDDRGGYTVKGAAPGAAVVTVHLRGFAPELRTVEVVAGQAAKLDVELTSGLMLSGLVVDGDGKPVAGAEVVAGKWRGKTTLGLRAMTAEDGRFLIIDAPADEFELVVTDRRAGRVVTVAKAGSDKPLKIALPNTRAASPGGDPMARFNVGDTAPTFVVNTLDGQSFKLADLKGKTVLLDFWATWCGPCVADLPHLLELREKFRLRKDFVMVGVSLDFDEKTLRDFLKTKKVAWTQVFGEDAQKTADRYGVQGIPSLFVIGPEGKIVAMDLRGEAIFKRVKAILEETDPT